MFLKALMWGCIFGSTIFNLIWIVTPSIRMLTIISNPIRLILTNLLQRKFLQNCDQC